MALLSAFTLAPSSHSISRVSEPLHWTSVQRSASVDLQARVRGKLDVPAGCMCVQDDKQLCILHWAVCILRHVSPRVLPYPHDPRGLVRRISFLNVALIPFISLDCQ